MAEGRRSLCYLNVEGCDVGKVHPCWNTVDNTVMDVKRAVVKARILTGIYYLQADRDKFRRSGTMSQCPHCSATSEDRLHFLIACVPLNQVRQSYITEIEKRLLQKNTAQCVTAALNDANFLAHLIIDCTSKVICDRLLLVDSDFHEVGGKKGNRTEPNRTNGLYRIEPTEISDCSGTGFYLRHRTETTNAIFTILLLFLLVIKLITQVSRFLFRDASNLQYLFE